MYSPSLREYLELSKRFNLIPVSGEYLADTQTPITVFWQVSGGRPGFLLESAEGGEKTARYSFLGVDPFLVYTHRGKTGRVLERGGAVREVAGNPLAVLKSLVSSFRAPELDLPRFFGGAAGYFGYDLVRWLEKLPSKSKDDLDLNDCSFLFCGTVLIFDHVRHTLRVVVNSFPGDSPAAAHTGAIKKIEAILDVLNGPEQRNLPALNGGANGRPERPRDPVFVPEGSNFPREGFLDAVKKAKEYIRRGDLLQVVLSQRFARPFAGDPFSVYRRLRAVNPSPYLYFLNFGELTVAGSSPEMLVRVEKENVETRPIAGTRPRGGTPPEDERLARELRNDPKERAEHVMLVDLGRNDLGRFCAPGSVEVPQFMAVEKYSHVMHLVSSVRGRLAPGKTAFDAFAACFPAGTVSGAPKVRAMEIIEELEPVRRGPYAGAVGYVGFNGNLDTAITIRTVLFFRGNAYVQAGAGIVADSDPAKEYAETVKKAQALLETLDLCESRRNCPASGCFYGQ